MENDINRRISEALGIEPKRIRYIYPQAENDYETYDRFEAERESWDGKIREIPEWLDFLHDPAACIEAWPKIPDYMWGICYMPKERAWWCDFHCTKHDSFCSAWCAAACHQLEIEVKNAQ